MAQIEIAYACAWLPLEAHLHERVLSGTPLQELLSASGGASSKASPSAAAKGKANDGAQKAQSSVGSNACGEWDELCLYDRNAVVAVAPSGDGAAAPQLFRAALPSVGAHPLRCALKWRLQLPVWLRNLVLWAFVAAVLLWLQLVCASPMHWFAYVALLGAALVAFGFSNSSLSILNTLQ